MDKNILQSIQQRPWNTYFQRKFDMNLFPFLRHFFKHFSHRFSQYTGNLVRNAFLKAFQTSLLIFVNSLFQHGDLSVPPTVLAEPAVMIHGLQCFRKFLHFFIYTISRAQPANHPPYGRCLWSSAKHYSLSVFLGYLITHFFDLSNCAYPK